MMFLFKKIVNFLGLRLDIDAYACFEGSHQKTRLNSVLQEGHEHFGRLVSQRQMRRWWYYFQKFGFVPAENKISKRIVNGWENIGELVDGHKRVQNDWRN